MVLNPSTGNMYGWVVTWNPLAGRCYHECDYCYVRKGRMLSLKKYQGEPYLDLKEMTINLYKCKKLKHPFTVFVCSCNDLFAKQVPNYIIEQVLWRCNEFPDNTYLFQSKNPWRFVDFYFRFPKNTILGTTLESNRQYNISKAPPVDERARAMASLSKSKDFKTMVSIEPILDFDAKLFFDLLRDIHPTFVSIGADSKGSGNPEPIKDKVELLIAWLEAKTQVKVKKNLNRIIK